MKKKDMLKTLLFTTLFTLGLTNADALTATVSTSDGTNFRREATTETDNVIKALKYNTKVELVSETKYEGPGCDVGWYNVTYDGSTGYICSAYLTINNTTTDSGTYYTTSGYEARISYTTVNVRSSANANITSNLKTKLMYGENVVITNTTSTGKGCDDNWYKIKYHNNETGYVCSTYVAKYTDITDTDWDEADKTYCDAIVAAGFPKSYCPYLVYLHNKHPNWNFNPVITKLKWKSVISNESGKNYITKQIDEPAYRVSDKLLDGGAWYELKDSVNAFYLDPRNFLNEENIFMFETLTFDEAINTYDNIEKLLNGTDLKTEATINSFINAGKRHNVSAIHAASRVIQEGVTKNTHHGLSGKSTLTYRNRTLSGYYNLFNIGAYKDSYTNNPVARGLAFACGAINGSGVLNKCGYYTSYLRPWNTIDAAINGGIYFLGTDYISIGQDTTYFQKFNTHNRDIEGASPNYTHQYMTNIQGPLGESFTTYWLYEEINAINNVSYTFSIPVYVNMPEELTTLPPIGDSTNTLSSLKINDELVHGFDSDVITYVKYVSNDTETIEITATPTSSAATITGTGTITLENETTEVSIIVTSETNEQKTYKISIIKTLETEMKIEDLINKLDVKTNENHIYITKPKTSVTSLLNTINKQSTTAILELVGKNNKKKSSGVLSTKDTLTITMLSGEQQKFTILVLGDNNADGKVDIADLLRIQKHILKYSTLKDDALTASDTNLDDKTDIADLLRVQKYILKKITDFK